MALPQIKEIESFYDTTIVIPRKPPSPDRIQRLIESSRFVSFSVRDLTRKTERSRALIEDAIEIILATEDVGAAQILRNVIAIGRSKQAEGRRSLINELAGVREQYRLSEGVLLSLRPGQRRLVRRVTEDALSAGEAYKALVGAYESSEVTWITRLDDLIDKDQRPALSPPDPWPPE